MSSGAVDDLRTYLEEIESAGELVHVRREVTPDRELAAVVKRLEVAGNPAVHFENVRGSSLSVASALFGTRERIARGMHSPMAEAVERFLAANVHPGATINVPDGPVKEVVRTGADVDLNELPISIHSAHDAGRFITSGVTFVRDPTTRQLNAGIYRMEVIDHRHVTINSSPALQQVTDQLAGSGERVEFVTVIGHHPALLVASQGRRDAAVSSLGVMAALLGSPVSTVSAATVALEIPAFAEVVLEGWLLPSRRREGAFGEFTYYYDPGTLVWMCEISAISRRVDAIYLDIHPTHVEHRCLWLFPGREAKLLASLRAGFPAVRAVRLPEHGAGMTAYIGLEGTHGGTAREVLRAALTADPYLKHAYAVDMDIDISDDRQVLWAMNVRFQGDRDLLVLREQPGARMDPSADRREGITLTTKLGFDATTQSEQTHEPRADVLGDDFRDLDLSEYLERRS